VTRSDIISEQCHSVQQPCDFENTVRTISTWLRDQEYPLTSSLASKSYKIEDSNWLFVYPRLYLQWEPSISRAVYVVEGELRSGYALVAGQPEHHPEGIYQLRYQQAGKRRWEPVGADPDLALSAKTRRETLLKAEVAELPVFDKVQNRDITRRPDRGSRPLRNQSYLDPIITEYLGDVRRFKSQRTYDAYRYTLKIFQECCSKRLIQDVDRRDIFNFMETLRRRGDAKRTVANRVSYLLIFLRKYGFADLIQSSDRPKYTKKIVKVYSSDQLRRLFAQCDDGQRVLFHFLLGSGCRKAEAISACWQDLDLVAKTYTVREKLDLGFSPKDNEERSIPLSDHLLDLLRWWRERNHDARLIFPGPGGKVDSHIIRKLKRLALQAGLNCGECRSRYGERCATRPICKEWELHRFRRTFATMHSAAGVKIDTIARWLGHADLQTTLAYLAADDDRSEHTRNQVNVSFANISD
jgi:integrase/recombinase XerD